MASLTLTRKKAGLNNFAISGLTLGKISAIKHSLEYTKKQKFLGPVGEELLEELTDLEVDTLQPWDNSCTKGRSL